MNQSNAPRFVFIHHGCVALARWPGVSAALLLCSVLLLPVILSCGGGQQERITLREPRDGAQVTGRVRIEVGVEGDADVAAVQVLAFDSKGKQSEIGSRSREPWVFFWDTLSLNDGSFDLWLVVVDGKGQQKRFKAATVKVANAPPAVSFVDCRDGMPVIPRFSVSLDVKTEKTLPKGVELFVDGDSVGRKGRAPFTFAVDLGQRKDGEQVLLSAVAVDSLQKGGGASCLVRVDRKAPRLSFLYPERDGQTIPLKFFALFSVMDPNGVASVTVEVDGRVLGTAKAPPFRVAVDLTGAANGKTVRLKAWATDRAGNRNVPALERTCVVDAVPPSVKLIAPVGDKAYSGKLTFSAELSDDAGLRSVDFSLLDSAGRRLDSMLHTSLKGKKSHSASVEVAGVVSLYGYGRRTFVVTAVDANGNVSKARRELTFGCGADTDCKSGVTGVTCYKFRCVVPSKAGQICSDAQPCDSGLVCHPGGLRYCSSEKIGICRTTCKKVGDPCGKGEFCLVTGVDKGVCLRGDACDPFTSNCAQGEQCVPWDSDSFVCLPAGKGAEGSACSLYTCDPKKGCSRGFACVQLRGRAVCHKLCETRFPTRDCGRDRDCADFPLRDSKRNTIGFCVDRQGSNP